MSDQNKQFSNPHLEACHHHFDKTLDLFHEVTDGLSEEQLRWKPAKQQWSTAENIGHLLASNQLYYERLKPLIETALAQGRNNPPWLEKHKSGFVGGMIRSVVDPAGKFKVKTFRSFVPREMATDEQRRQYLDCNEKLLRLLEQSDGLNTRKLTIASPVSGLLRINLGDAFSILPAHAERHLNQAARLRKHPDFPGN